MKKFLDYARWDLTMRRSTYIRVIWMTALAGALPTIGYLIKLLYNAFYGVAPLALLVKGWNAFTTDSTIATVGMISAICIAFMFTTLKDRPGRLSEFMLPAPNWMKFLWRALLVTVGAFVFGQVVLVALGLIRYLVTVLFVGIGSADLMIWAQDVNISSVIFIDMEPNYGISQTTGGLIPSMYVASLMMMICGLAFRAVFVLTSAFKYRRGVLYGLLVHGIVFLILMYIAVNNTDVNPDFTPKEFGWTCYLITFVHLLILVVCWWGAWRLYRNAQLTTRRNP